MIWVYKLFYFHSKCWGSYPQEVEGGKQSLTASEDSKSNTPNTSNEREMRISPSSLFVVHISMTHVRSLS